MTGGEPRVHRLDYGALCVSIDVEGAWGIWDVPNRGYFERCWRLERSVVARLVELFSRYGVTATWAVVGRLMERRVPYAAAPDDSVWYAPDVVEMIRDAPVRQEIGSHSFEHIYFGGVSEEAAVDDVTAAVRVHRERDLEFVSFVFPRNDISHLNALRAAGVEVFRGVDEGLHVRVGARAGRLAGRAAHLLERLMPTTPAVVHPRIHTNGLVELPGSMLLLHRLGIRRVISPGMLEAKARRGLRAAALRGGVFHLWFHPSNFYYETERQFEVLEGILREADSLRRTRDLRIVPMGYFASLARTPR